MFRECECNLVSEGNKQRIICRELVDAIFGISAYPDDQVVYFNVMQRYIPMEIQDDAIDDVSTIFSRLTTVRELKRSWAASTMDYNRRMHMLIDGVEYSYYVNDVDSDEPDFDSLWYEIHILTPEEVVMDEEIRGLAEVGVIGPFHNFSLGSTDTSAQRDTYSPDDIIYLANQIKAFRARKGKSVKG